MSPLPLGSWEQASGREEVHPTRRLGVLEPDTRGEAPPEGAQLHGAMGDASHEAPAGASREVLVAQAETGLAFNLPAESSDSVLALKAALAPTTGVDLSHQILLLDGDMLADEHTLAEYGLPHVGAPRSRPVFLFNRRSLSRSAAEQHANSGRGHEMATLLVCTGTGPGDQPATSSHVVQLKTRLVLRPQPWVAAGGVSQL